MIRQGIAGSSVDPSNPVTLSFKHINSEGGRPIEVRVYGINGTNSWLPFSPFDCTGCAVLYSYTITTPFSPATLDWQTHTVTFTPGVLMP
jgi:hypothetical protein